MEERDILVEVLRDEYPEPTEVQITRLDADVTKLAHILLDYFIEQKRHGKKISDPYAGDSSHERNNLCTRISSRPNRRHKP